jgi:RND family efflux transporter MFP subunit
VSVGVSPVTTGNISVNTAYAAVVEPRDYVDVAPLATGRIEKLLVDVGTPVKTGDVIVELGHGLLDAQLDQARASLRNAETKLASVQAGMELKQVEAQAKLDAAQAALAQLLDPSPADLQAARSAVAQRQSGLDSANTALAQLLSPSASAILAKESAVAAAESNLESIRSALDFVLSPTVAGLQAAESGVVRARSTLESAEARLDDLLNPSAARVAAAREALANAESGLTSAQTKVNQTISALITKGDLPVGVAEEWLDARKREDAYRASLVNPDLSRTHSPAQVAAIQENRAANQEAAAKFLSQITGAGPLPENLSAAMLAEAKAESTLVTAKERLDELLNPSSSDVATSHNAVATAQAALESAEAKFEEIENADQRTIDSKRAAEAAAEAALESAKEALNELQDPQQFVIDLKQHNVDNAQAMLAAAKAKLDILEDPRPSDIAVAEARVASAELALAKTMPPFSQFDLAIAQAAVDRAQGQVDLVNQQLEDRNVRAPFDGSITRAILGAGAMVSERPKTPIVTLATDDVIVSLRVEETGINSLQTGQTVKFTSPALPGQALDLLVGPIAPRGDEKTFTFLVKLKPTEVNPDLKAGMSGQVTISTSHQNTLLVPREAVLRHAGQPAVFVVQDNKAHLRMIGVGLNDGVNVEIHGNIRVGDQVVVSGHNLLSEGDAITIDTARGGAASAG